mgnify:FL=1
MTRPSLPSTATTVAARSVREVRGCGWFYAERFPLPYEVGADPSAVKVEVGKPQAEAPSGFVRMFGTARLCMRPFGHDGSDRTGWSLNRVTGRSRHSGPRVWFQRLVRQPWGPLPNPHPPVPEPIGPRPPLPVPR